MSSRSTYLYKDKGGKIKIGPVWDFNNVCDNYLALKYSTEGFYFAENRIWYEMLLKDEEFVKKVQERYKELRNTYLNEEYITESHRLAAQDIIELGDSKFLFVPLCGETFSWEEHMPKGE